MRVPLDELCAVRPQAHPDEVAGELASRRVRTETAPWSLNELRRVLRFRRVVSAMRAGRSPADVAAATGYADQPHLHREVRAFADTTATALASG